MTVFAGLAFRKDPRWRGHALYPTLAGALALPFFMLANALPEVFSWFYLWLLCVPLGFIEYVAWHLRRLTR